jgi:hypothetical protein
MNDIDILIPKTAAVTILGRRVEIKPLSIKSAVELGRILGNMHEALKAAAPNAQNILPQILHLAGAQKAGEIINILTSNALADVKNIEDKLTLLEASALTKAVFEVNDFSEIYLNFTTALGTKHK